MPAFLEINSAGIAIVLLAMKRGVIQQY